MCEFELELKYKIYKNGGYIDFNSFINIGNV